MLKCNLTKGEAVVKPANPDQKVYAKPIGELVSAGFPAAATKTSPYDRDLKLENLTKMFANFFENEAEMPQGSWDDVFTKLATKLHNDPMCISMLSFEQLEEFYKHAGEWVSIVGITAKKSATPVNESLDLSGDNEWVFM